ncbi:MAG TPA: glycosyltransferase [Acidimicrobiia bacterium]|jgi:hypothetical protein
MPEGSDSADHGRPAPFDQDGPSDQGEQVERGERPNRRDVGRRDAGERDADRRDRGGYETGLGDEPDFADFLAESRLEQQSAATKAAQAHQAMTAALAGADEWYSVEADLSVEVRPPVVAIVPTRGGDGLERCLAALAEQDYPGLTVLALDGSPAAEALAGRVAAAAPHTLVRRVEDPSGGLGPAAAALADDVIESVQGATFFVFCADDVVLDRNAVRMLADEAIASNAGIVGPKLVSDAARDELVDVGWLIDRYGEAWSIAEPGERDQEQHDAVRDVFFVSARAMLVRCDLFTALDGFDAACAAAAARDLAWRARIAGARVVVAPEARAAVLPKPPEATLATPVDVRALTRGRLRALYKTAATWSLVWTFPLALLLIVFEALLQAVRGRASYSGAILGGAADAFRDIPELRTERAAIQKARVAPDADLHPYMVRGSARLRRLVTRRLHVDERLAGASIRTRAFFGGGDDGERSWRSREGLLLGALIVVSLVATRTFVSGGTPSFAGLLSWPRASTLFHDFSAGRRSTFFGADVAAPPLLAACGALVALFLGHADLARTALVTLAIPAGMVIVYQMLRRTSLRAWPALAAATAYGANPVSRNAIARGELGVIALYVLAPLLLIMVSGRPRADNAPSARVMRTRDARIGRILRLALVTAVAIAWWPPAVLLVLLLACADLAGAALTGVQRPADVLLDVVADAACATVVAILLLLPWSVAFASGDGTRIGFQARSPVTLQQLVGVNAGPNGAGWLGLGLLAAAALPLLIATGERLRRSVAAWTLIVFAVVVPLVAQHISAHTPLPDIDGFLVIAALAISVAVGLGVAAFIADLRTFIFGARQLVAVGCLVVLVLPLIAWLGDVPDGRVHAPHTQWNDELSWMPTEAARDGAFRVLWLGPAASLPGGSVHADGIDFSVTDSGVGDVRSSLPQTSEPTRLAGESVALAAGQDTERLGRLLAPMAVRYVALVDRAAPDAQAQPIDRRLVRALDAQLDLELYDTETGLRLYRNGAWAPKTSVLSNGSVPTGAAASRDPIGAALATDLSGAHKLGNPSGSGTLMLSDNAGAKATLNGKTLAGETAFGWAHAWPLNTSGHVVVKSTRSFMADFVLLLAALGWLAVAFLAFRPSAFSVVRPRRSTASGAAPPNGPPVSGGGA